MDESLLISLGLAGKEVTLYKEVLKSGSATPALLGKVCGVKRTTAYSIARSLVEKGFLVEDATRRPRIFSATSPDDVLLLIDAERKRLDEKEGSLKRLSAELSKISAKTSYPVPTVRFVEEDKIEQFLRQQSPVWNKSLTDSEPTWWGFQDHTFVEHYNEWILWYWKQAWAPIDLKLLSNRAEAEIKFGPQIGPQRQIKFWGEATNFHSTTWAIGEYVVMINTRNKPFYLVEIHDKLMAHDHREVFKNLWPLV